MLNVIVLSNTSHSLPCLEQSLAGIRLDTRVKLKLFISIEIAGRFGVLYSGTDLTPALVLSAHKTSR